MVLAEPMTAGYPTSEGDVLVCPSVGAAVLWGDPRTMVAVGTDDRIAGTTHTMTIDQAEPVTLHASRLDEVEEAMAAMPVHFRRLTTNTGPVSLTAVAVEDLAIFVGEVEFPIVSEGQMSENALLVCFQLEEGDGWWDGHDLALDRVWFYRPGSEHEGVGRKGPLGRPPRFVTISIPIESRCGDTTAAAERATRRWWSMRRYTCCARRSATLSDWRIRVR